MNLINTGRARLELPQANDTKPSYAGSKSSINCKE